MMRCDFIDALIVIVVVTVAGFVIYATISFLYHWGGLA